jgi:hypothetical protein
MILGDTLRVGDGIATTVGVDITLTGVGTIIIHLSIILIMHTAMATVMAMEMVGTMVVGIMVVGITAAGMAADMLMEEVM